MKLTKITNKKGGEEFLTIWNFIIWAVIAVAIITGTLVFYSQEINVKTYEAEILRDRIMRCITTEGMMNELISGTLNIYEECSLEETILGKTNAEYYMNITTKDAEGEVLNETIIGNKDYEIQCKINEEGNSKNLPQCVTRNEEITYKDSEEKIQKISVRMLVGSNNEGIK